jgi:hypothetical protein
VQHAWALRRAVYGAQGPAHNVTASPAAAVAAAPIAVLLAMHGGKRRDARPISVVAVTLKRAIAQVHADFTQ